MCRLDRRLFKPKLPLPTVDSSQLPDRPTYLETPVRQAAQDSEEAVLVRCVVLCTWRLSLFLDVGNNLWSPWM